MKTSVDLSVPATSSMNQSMMFWGCSFESKTPEVTPYIIEGIPLTFNHLVNRQARSYLSFYPIH
jgi:hypothetical protein